ncbi:GNAT family protein [Halobacterium salinarum]|uniref:GNAT family N-acetyltransferase n=1 Tax=Halobacterium salinarum TaxID=2242 RepID=UPI00255474B2|nr:GNAT family protein [Halobacterium salinarum]MDL0120571.1 GNAT family protein [Halobacterium salinarum]
MPGPIVTEGDRVTLRTVERDDAAHLQRSCTDPRIRHSLGSVHHRSREQQADGIEHWVEDDASVVAVVCVDDEDAPPGRPAADETTPIGSFSARHVDSDRAWLAYWLRPEYTGSGYGRDMATTGIDYVFAQYGVHNVSAAAYDFNEASRGLLAAMGFTEVGRRREARYIDGGYADEVWYDVLRHEWTADRER